MFHISPSLPVRETDDIVLETVPVKISDYDVKEQIIDAVQKARKDYDRMDKRGEIAYDDPFECEEDWEKLGDETDEELAAVLGVSHLNHLQRILAYFATRQDYWDGMLRRGDAIERELVSLGNAARKLGGRIVKFRMKGWDFAILHQTADLAEFEQHLAKIAELKDRW